MRQRDLKLRLWPQRPFILRSSGLCDAAFSSRLHTDWSKCLFLMLLWFFSLRSKTKSKGCINYICRTESLRNAMPSPELLAHSVKIKATTKIVLWNAKNQGKSMLGSRHFSSPFPPTILRTGCIMLKCILHANQKCAQQCYYHFRDLLLQCLTVLVSRCQSWMPNAR